jgi:hypothetical protein
MVNGRTHCQLYHRRLTLPARLPQASCRALRAPSAPRLCWRASTSSTRRACCLARSSALVGQAGGAFWGGGSSGDNWGGLSQKPRGGVPWRIPAAINCSSRNRSARVPTPGFSSPWRLPCTPPPHALHPLPPPQPLTPAFHPRTHAPPDRQYSFIDAVQWFAGRSDMILLLFDPFKLVGAAGRSWGGFTRPPQNLGGGARCAAPRWPPLAEPLPAARHPAEGRPQRPSRCLPSGRIFPTRCGRSSTP